MLPEKELEKALEKIQTRFDTVNRLYIRKIAAQIKSIGQLSQSSINRLVIMAEMTSNVEEITQELMNATGLMEEDVRELYSAAMRDVYTDPRFTRAFSGGVNPPVAQQRLRQYTRSVVAQTLGTMENLSNTTAISEPYRQIVSTAITAVSAGLTSYTAATRAALRQIGYNGLQVQYESGYHRRLDTALRQNIIDGVNQIAQNGAKIYGDVLQYDAVELSAHMHSAKDHEAVQGRVFLLDEFDRMQHGQSCKDVDGLEYEGFKRPIAEWNCKHIAVPFSTQFSKRLYSNEQLDQWRKENNAGCEIDGKHYSLYQVEQLMRQTETEVRRLKDAAVAAQIAGDDPLRRRLQLQINDLGLKYSQICRISGLTSQRSRMTVEGFKPVRIK